MITVTVLTVAIQGLPALANSSSRKNEVAVARKALIVLSDFPKGWSTSPSGGNSNGSAGNAESNAGVAQAVACLGIPKSALNYNAPAADSPYFNENALGLSVSDEVDIFSTSKIAAEFFNIYGSSRSVGCFQRVFRSTAMEKFLAGGIGRGATVGATKVIRFPKPVAGNESAAMEELVPFTYKGISSTVVVVTVVIMSKSKSKGAMLTFSNPIESPFATSLAVHLETVTANRLN